MKKEDILILGGLGLLALLTLARRGVAEAKPGARVVVAKKVAEKAGARPGEELTPSEVTAIQGQLYKVPSWLQTATLAPFTVKVGRTPSVPVVVPVRKGFANVAIEPVANVKRFLGWVSSITVSHPTYAQLRKQGVTVTPSSQILQSLYGTKRPLPPSITPPNVVTQRGIATQAKTPISIIAV